MPTAQALARGSRQELNKNFLSRTHSASIPEVFQAKSSTWREMLSEDQARVLPLMYGNVLSSDSSLPDGRFFINRPRSLSLQRFAGVEKLNLIHTGATGMLLAITRA
jgi:hypothetical protein